MGKFQAINALAVKKKLQDPEGDARDGKRILWVMGTDKAEYTKFVAEHPPYNDGVAAVYPTMALANAATSADRPDEVRVTAGHTETFSVPLSLSSAGVEWVGLGKGLKKPALTISKAAGAVQHNGIALLGEGTSFKGFHFTEPGADNLPSMVFISAAGASVEDITGIASGVIPSTGAVNFVDCIRVAGEGTSGSSSSDLNLNNIRLWSAGNGGAAVPTSFLTFESAISRFASAGFYANGSIGTAGVVDDSGATIKGAMIEDWNIVVGTAGKPALTFDTGGSFGYFKDCFFAGQDTTIADNFAITAGDWRVAQCFVSEETGGTASGARFPAFDSD